MTTGINTAAVPVLDKNPDRSPVIIIIAIIKRVSVFATLVTKLPTSTARPVSKNAAPTINIPINNNTFVSTNPANAAFADNTPVK